MAGNSSNDIPGTDFPANINDWTPAQREQVGQALGVLNPTTISGLKVLANDPGGDVTKADLKSEETGKDSTTGPTPPAAALPESPYVQLADAQADQYLQMTKNMDAQTSGYSAPSNQATVNSESEAMLGQSSTSPMAQWLKQQSANAAAQFAPVQAADSQVATAEDSAAKLEATGLQQLGTAEQAAFQAAPYQSLLNSLAAEVPYQLVKGYLPGMKDVPTFIQQVEQNVGVPTAGQSTTSSGTTPILPLPSTTSTTAQTLTTPDTSTPAGP